MTTSHDGSGRVSWNQAGTRRARIGRSGWSGRYALLRRNVTPHPGLLATVAPHARLLDVSYAHRSRTRNPRDDQKSGFSADEHQRNHDEERPGQQMMLETSNPIVSDSMIAVKRRRGRSQIIAGGFRGQRVMAAQWRFNAAARSRRRPWLSSPPQQCPVLRDRIEELYGSGVSFSRSSLLSGARRYNSPEKMARA